MGFINKNILLTAYLTQKGKEEIIDGVGIEITQFLLGDSDSNYTVASDNFDVVDLSGREDCLKGVSGDVSIKYPVFLSGDTTPTINFLFNNNIVTAGQITKENGNTDQIKIVSDFPMIDDLEINVQLSSLTQFTPSEFTYMGETKPFLNNNIVKFFIFQRETESDTLSISYQELPLVPSGTTLNSVITNIQIIDTNQPIIEEIEGFNVVLNGGVIPQITFSTRVQNTSADIVNGKIFIENVRNGQMPYSFSIIRNDNGVVIRNNVPITNINTTEVQNIGAGTYTVSVKDVNGYVTERVVSVGETAAPILPFDFTLTKVRDSLNIPPFNVGTFELTAIQNGAGFPYEMQVSSANGQFNQIFTVNSIPFRVGSLAPNLYNVIIRKGIVSSPIRQITIGSENVQNLIIEPIRSTILANPRNIIGFRIRNLVRVGRQSHRLQYLREIKAKRFVFFDEIFILDQIEGIMEVFNLPPTEVIFAPFQNQVKFVEADTNREVIYTLTGGDVIIPNRTN